jgi:hypothetical protein
MANHVETWVRFHNLSDEGVKKLNEIYARHPDWGDEQKYDFDVGPFIGLSEDAKYDDYINSVGAKWCYIEDPDDEGFRSTSAWSVPWDFINKLCEELAEVDEHLFVSVEYEDEMPNFTGWSTWHHGSYDEGREWEWEEIEDWVMDNRPDIAELFDREERDWKEGKEDEGRDLMWDAQMEFMEDVRYRTLTEETTWYFNHEEEILEDYKENNV